ncbi:ATP-binding cassette domain-containing protein [Paracoccus sp. S-4012]|uniref:ABC transporter ATP-binding protein n=1 Tax=Paracoccus sp. S-4012 TaxID=2665648 RepID=UPI0012AF1860|nr:ABC transporter ATP-binding protein [Paracoccus sp. S-4012]MRX51794.1 ATP-binding cassette domain-containing protein [Paracoccus sp. S-4012]
MTETIVSVRNLTRTFVQGGAGGKQLLKAVEDVSFDIRRGETLGLVGESGSGKSTIGKVLVGALPPSEGTVDLFGTRITPQSRDRAWKPLRHRVQFVFQDPHAALNPRMRVGQSIAEPLEVKGGMSRADRHARVEELMELVGLPPNFLDRFPHEFSGGQRQRIVIARALALNPDFVICDEAVASLDVSMQAQIINLLKDLQDRMGLSYLFIAHDLAVVRAASHRIAVLYAGQVVELAQRSDLYQRPLHPYTRALLDAVPRARKRQRPPVLGGEVPSLLNKPRGCNFSTRCPLATEHCRQVEPALREVEGRQVACHLV